MNVLVTGGTGSLGRPLVCALLGAGHQVTVMSRRSRRPSDPKDFEWRQADIAKAGWDAVLEGIETIIHAASDPLHSAIVDVGGTRNIVAAARSKGAGHIIYVSIVGIDRIPLGYYRNKLAAEDVIKSSAVPHSILRATQFHSLIDLGLSLVRRIPIVMPLATDFTFQPVAETEVAGLLAACVGEGPRGALADFGGPERLTLREMAETWMQVTRTRRSILSLPLTGAVARGFRAGLNTTPNEPRGTMRWREWLTRKYEPHPA